MAVQGELEYKNVRKASKKQTAFDYLEESGFIGSLKGKAHLSSDYKRLLADSLKEKHSLKGKSPKIVKSSH